MSIFSFMDALCEGLYGRCSDLSEVILELDLRRVTLYIKFCDIYTRGSAEIKFIKYLKCFKTTFRAHMELYRMSNCPLKVEKNFIIYALCLIFN